MFFSSPIFLPRGKTDISSPKVWASRLDLSQTKATRRILAWAVTTACSMLPDTMRERQCLLPSEALQLPVVTLRSSKGKHSRFKKLALLALEELSIRNPNTWRLVVCPTFFHAQGAIANLSSWVRGAKHLSTHAQRTQVWYRRRGCLRSTSSCQDFP